MIIFMCSYYYDAQLVIKPLQLTIISHSPSLSLILHYNADASHSL